MNKQKENIKNKLIESGWFNVLEEFFKTDDYKQITHNIAADILNGKKIYPKTDDVFKAFILCPLNKIKCVILDDSPYYTPNTATGLAFGVHLPLLPASLVNIINEVENDLDISINEKIITLEGWAKQGVLLLNTALTVIEGVPNSHKDIGWDKFTEFVINYINKNKEFVGFLLWGKEANKYLKFIDIKKHGVFFAEHPSHLNGHLFKNCKHFSKLNSLLISKNIEQIDWSAVNENKHSLFDFMNKNI